MPSPCPAVRSHHVLARPAASGRSGDGRATTPPAGRGARETACRQDQEDRRRHQRQDRPDHAERDEQAPRMSQPSRIMGLRSGVWGGGKGGSRHAPITKKHAPPAGGGGWGRALPRLTSLGAFPPKPLPPAGRGAKREEKLRPRHPQLRQHERLPLRILPYPLEPPGLAAMSGLHVHRNSSGLVSVFFARKRATHFAGS